MSDSLATARAAAFKDIKLTDGEPAPQWRLIITDSESPTGLAPVCSGEHSDRLHMIDDYPGGPKRDDEGVYDCCPYPQIETYSTAWAAYLVELLNADAAAGLLPKADVVTWLTKKAREIPRGNKIGRAQGDVLAVMASKVARGAVRPDNLRMLPPDFYEVGRTYTDPSADYDWKFRVDAITTHPQTGERMALGWRHFRGEWAEMAYGEDSFEIHLIAGMADATEDGGQ